MLTGPVTMLAWSFVRDDQPLSHTARQVALALRDEITDLEAARSHMELVTDLRRAGYQNGIGPGVWDIHSPRVPSVEEMEHNLRRAVQAVDPARVWVNPDCGLKTRAYPETEASLRNLVAAAVKVRAHLR